MLLALGVFSAAQADSRNEGGIKVHVAFDNMRNHRRLRTAWGFAVVVQATGQTILFDTVSDGRILLSNMRRMHLPVDAIEPCSFRTPIGTGTVVIRKVFIFNQNECSASAGIWN